MTERARAAPDFSSFRAVELRNVSGAGAARLMRADEAVASAGREVLVGQVTQACNEPLIYDVLFRPRLRGAPYPRDSAERFLDRAARGWREGTHFVFFILAQGDLAGNVEIETADLDSAEIGYWASARWRGFMTPAVLAVCDAARAAGYGSLYAHVRVDNERSTAVLRRAHFEEVGLVPSGEHSHRMFLRLLGRG